MLVLFICFQPVPFVNILNLAPTTSIYQFICLSVHLPIYVSIVCIYLSQRVSGFHNVIVCSIFSPNPIVPRDQIQPFPHWVSVIFLSYLCRFIPSHSRRSPLWGRKFGEYSHHLDSFIIIIIIIINFITNYINQSKM